jgi:hypothetical protein
MLNGLATKALILNIFSLKANLPVLWMIKLCKDIPFRMKCQLEKHLIKLKVMNPYNLTSLNKPQINKNFIKGHECFFSDNQRLKINLQYLYAVRLCRNVIKGIFVMLSPRN